MGAYWDDRSSPLTSNLVAGSVFTRRGFVRRAVALGVGASAGAVLLGANRLPVAAETAPATDAGFPGREAFADLDTKKLVKAIRASSFSDANVVALIEALARAGVAVYANPGDSAPVAPVDGEPSPVSVLKWQARNMALEISARGGHSGADLDGLVDGSATLLPSTVLAAYATAGSTAGAEFARAVVGKRDAEEATTTLFPMVVQLLFSADLARGGAQPSGFRRALAPSAFRADENEGKPEKTRLDNVGGDVPACAGMQDFIDETVWRALIAMSKTPEDLPGKQVAEEIRDYLYHRVDDPDADKRAKYFLAQLYAVAKMLALASQLISVIKAWAVRLEADPTSTRFGVDKEVVDGAITARVDVGGLDAWPADLRNCSHDAGLLLPPLLARGEAISWEMSELPIPLAEYGQLPAVLDDDGRARMGYVMNTESSEAAQGEARKGRMTVRATVERNQFAQYVYFLMGRIWERMEKLPPDAIVPLADTADVLYGRLDGLTKATGQRSVTVVYHEKKKGKATAKKDGQQIDNKLVGIWQVTDLSSLVGALLNDDEAPIQMYVQGMDGSLTYNFGKDASLGIAAEAFASSSGADTEFGHMDITVFVEGAALGTYSADGGNVTLEFGGVEGISGQISVVAMGAEVVNRPVENLGLLFPNATIPYEVSGDELRLYTSPEISVPIVLTRIG